ncbi:hypothetical protein C7S20_19155 [Christiangramia fulva]|uniref:HTH araC/xylS-type domain-containing protein n=1 Tax=Christiangramia fulva TaxID=2126553 RepID=A0A2R3ZAA5_9FLAO|nr:AraC family transcriptional regulator [Christiangramia fulva]AVR47197.1 hypothetical protein C7S20_19155 [Christiangramia fulva]
MERKLTRENAWPIFQMLTEMARGNFSYKISRGNYKDLLEAIYEQLNMTAQELNGNFKHVAYVNPHHSYRFITNTVIILDDKDLIVAYSSEQDRMIEKLPKILNKPFADFLTPKSFETWKHVNKEIKNGSSESYHCQLEFQVGKELVMAQECSVDLLVSSAPNYHMSISFFQNRVRGEIRQEPEDRKRLSKWDVISLQEVHDYLLQNIGKPKPTDKELARKFKLNEYRLHRGFLELFGCTPFRYYNLLRLEEAKTRISSTFQTLDTIASDLNFKSYPQFSEAFKKKYGHPPSYFRS